MSTTLEQSDKAAKQRAYRSAYYHANKDKFRGYKKKYRTKDPEKTKLDERRRFLKSKYGLSLEQYEEMLEAQGFACNICGGADPNDRYDKFHVDHCHSTGVIRGLLCYKCNVLLGVANDSPSILTSAISYLKQFEEPHAVH